MVQFSADAAAGALCTLTSTKSSINITTAEHRARDCAMAAPRAMQQCAAVGYCGTDKPIATVNQLNTMTVMGVLF